MLGYTSIYKSGCPSGIETYPGRLFCSTLRGVAQKTLCAREVLCILEGSVVTYLRCGGTFTDDYLLLSLAVKEFSKPVSIYSFKVVGRSVDRPLVAPFTRATLASADISCRHVPVCLSVSLSVRPSVTSQRFIETAKRRITLSTPHESPWTLVF